MQIRITGLTTIPEVRPGDRLSEVIRAAVDREQVAVDGKTVIVVAQKIVSKAENAMVDLRTVQPSQFAQRWSAEWGKDARVIETVLRASRRIVRMDQGVLITETHHGFVTANAGVDQSNTPGDDYATLLPQDPDASARTLRLELECGAVIISDSFGRPWRDGLVNIAIGASGMDALSDQRGQMDRRGRMLQSTVVSQIDELAAAAGLVMAKAAGVPVAIIEGFEWEPAEGSARALIRPRERDLFR